MFGARPSIDIETIQKEIDAGDALLVDVRSDGEYSASHARGAAHLDVDRILQGETPTKDTDTKLYLYCASGGRSGTAQRILQNSGFNAENIGGLSHWQAAGGNVERG